MNTITTNDEFIVAYMKARKEGVTLDELSKKLGAKPGYSGVKASWLRKQGVKLPFMKRGNADKTAEIARLNKLVSENR
jgi:hypothetical protein